MEDNTKRTQAQDGAVFEANHGDLVERYESGEMVGQPGSEPDVFLDVSELRVEEITLDVEDLRAKVSLQAEVLELLKLGVGADVQLGKVHLEIRGVAAQALLKVRLDRVEAIVGRVLTTIDRNPQILEQLTSAVGGAARELGRGAGDSVGELGREAGSAVGDVGRQTGAAVGDVEESAGAVAREGVRGAVRDVGEAAEDVSGAAAEARGQIGDTADKTLGRAGAGGRDRGVREQTSQRQGLPRRPKARWAQNRSREARHR